MINKVFIFVAIFILLSPGPAHADYMVGLSLYYIPFLLPIVLIEFFIFRVFCNKQLPKRPTAKKIFGAVVTVNLASALLGLVLPGFRSSTQLLRTLTMAFFASVFVEGIAYIPFFKNFKLSILRLFSISFIGNSLTYLMMASLLIPAQLDQYEASRGDRTAKSFINDAYNYTICTMANNLGSEHSSEHIDAAMLAPCIERDGEKGYHVVRIKKVDIVNVLVLNRLSKLEDWLLPDEYTNLNCIVSAVDNQGEIIVLIFTWHNKGKRILSLYEDSKNGIWEHTESDILDDVKSQKAWEFIFSRLEHIGLAE